MSKKKKKKRKENPHKIQKVCFHPLDLDFKHFNGNNFSIKELISIKKKDAVSCKSAIGWPREKV